MDVTQLPYKEKNKRAKKQMLWFGIISLCMGFAGLTSAYVVSSKRKDWLQDFELPQEFLISTVIIMASSVTLWLAGRALKKGNNSLTAGLTIATVILGGVFTYLQFAGFNSILDMGYYPTGESSNITFTFIYLIVLVHLAHLAVGFISLLFVAVKTLTGKYTPQEMLGFELGATFWHFVDFLWLYLFLFFYFFR